MSVLSIPEIRHATAADYEPLLNWLNGIFQPDVPNFFQNSYAHVFHGPESITDTSLVLQEGRQYLGHITMLPLEIKTSIGNLRTGAIGQVAVDPSARGRGLLHVLMQAAHREALAKGCVIGFLGGVRSLYSRFGYEICGMNYEWMWDRQGRKAASGPHLLDSVSVADAIHEHWGRKPYGVCWSRDVFGKVLQRPLWEVWKSGSGTAYALLHKGAGRRMVDGFFGDAEEFQSLLDSLCEDSPIYIRHGTGDTMMEQWMEESGMDITRKGNGMIKILDVRGLRKNMPMLEQIAGHEFSKDPNIIRKQRLAVRELFGDPFDKFHNPNPILWGWESISYV